MRPMARYSKNYSRASVLVPKRMAGSLDAPPHIRVPFLNPIPFFLSLLALWPVAQTPWFLERELLELVDDVVNAGAGGVLVAAEVGSTNSQHAPWSPDERATSQRSQSGVAHSEQMYSTHIDGTSASGIGRDRLVEQGLRSREMMVCS